METQWYEIKTGKTVGIEFENVMKGVPVGLIPLASVKPSGKTMNTITPISTLPKILAILGCTDHGPCDDGPTATCPHCGAGGRYVYRFLCDDGKIHGAMAGCIQLFPKHPLTDKVATVFEKLRDYEKKKWKCSSWDQEIVDACASLESGSIAVEEWERKVNGSIARRNAWLAKKYGPNQYRRR